MADGGYFLKSLLIHSLLTTALRLYPPMPQALGVESVMETEASPVGAWLRHTA